MADLLSALARFSQFQATMELASHTCSVCHSGALPAAPPTPPSRRIQFAPSRSDRSCAQRRIANRWTALSAVRRGGGRRRRDEALLDNWEETAASESNAGAQQNDASDFQAVQQNGTQRPAQVEANQARPEGGSQWTGAAYDREVRADNATDTSGQPSGASSPAYATGQPNGSRASVCDAEQQNGSSASGSGRAQQNGSSTQGVRYEPNAAPAADDWGDWGDWGSSSGSASSARGSSQPDSAKGWRIPFQSRRTTNGAASARANAQTSNGPEAQDDDWYDGAGDPPDITTLTLAERERMLRIAPFREQVDYFNKDPALTVQRWATAGVIALLASTKGPLLAAGALTSPAWWPWVQAAYRNNSLVSQYTYIGLWRTRVLQVEVQGRRTPRFSDTPANARAARSTQALHPYFQLMVGDDSGARTQLAVPYDSRYDEVRVGESAELLVVATKSTFEDFKALKEAYLPESSLWLADYPYVDRDVFLDFSLQIERERSSSADTAAMPYL